MFLRRAFILLPLAAAATALAAADEPDLDIVQGWLAQDSPNPKWFTCPRSAYTQGNPTTGRNPSEGRNPFFGYGTPAPSFECRQSGPYAYNGEQWWLQLVTDVVGSGPLAGKWVDALRACSPTRVVVAGAPPPPTTPGPCLSPDGVGPRGCQVCARTVRAPDS